MEKFLREVCGFERFEIKPLKQDASSRRYWRIFNNGKSYVLMDGDAKANRYFEFYELAKLLAKYGARVPEVLHRDFKSGFMLLEDLGDDTFTKLLADGAEEGKLYRCATEILVKVAKVTSRPAYVADLSDERIVNDICFFVDWYYPLTVGRPLESEKRAEFVRIVEELLPLARKVPESLVLWDYHVDNVMMVKDNCAVIDFQDALWGPVTYDIMSLIEDARRDVSPKVHAEMLELFYKSLSRVSRENFVNSFDFFAMFRHMRVLGRFSILMAKHDKDAYLVHVPRLWKMLMRALENPNFVAMKKWVEENLPPHLRVAPKRKKIDTAMILAAGRGTRMRELGDELPKPLIKIKGKTLLDYKLDMIREVNIKNVVVNVCYQKEKLKEHLANVKDINILISEEAEALETGGGVKKALPLLGSLPFFTINTDEIWKDAEFKPAMWRMIDVWDDEKYDILLLLVPMGQVVEKDLKLGNYRVLKDGSIERNVDRVDGFEYFYPGTALVHPRVFEGSPDGKFSMRDLYDKAQAEGRLGYVVMGNKVYHVGTPEDKAEAEILF